MRDDKYSYLVWRRADWLVEADRTEYRKVRYAQRSDTVQRSDTADAMDTTDSSENVARG